MEKRKLKKFNTKGFSLIEVVVSLVVLSISILAIYQVIISNTTSIMYLEDRYLAKEVTNNRVALINTMQKPNNATRRTGIMKMGNKVWRWEGNGIDKESGAKSAGIKIGDIIKDIDGIKISKFSDLKGYLNTKRPNDIVNINLKRDNESRKVSVQLNRNERINFYLIGILKNMSQKELSEKELNQGVKISEFNSDYKNYWEDYGVKEGDVIKKINGTVINSISDIDKIVKSRNYYDPVTIEILTADNKTERFNFR